RSPARRASWSSPRAWTPNDRRARRRVRDRPAVRRGRQDLRADARPDGLLAMRGSVPGPRRRHPVRQDDGLPVEGWAPVRAVPGAARDDLAVARHGHAGAAEGTLRGALRASVHVERRGTVLCVSERVAGLRPWPEAERGRESLLEVRRAEPRDHLPRSARRDPAPGVPGAQGAPESAGLSARAVPVAESAGRGSLARGGIPARRLVR